MIITDDNVRTFVLSYMSARCDVRSQHKLPGRDELSSTVMAEVVGTSRLTRIVDEMIQDGTLIDYDGYISDHPIDVL